MGSSPSCQPGTSSQTQTTYSSQRPSNRLSPSQSQVVFAWGGPENSDHRESTTNRRNCETMVCETCKVNFNLLKRKYLCFDCKKHYCNACSAKEQKRCHNCLRFKCRITRERLEEMKIKDLRQYLNVHNISTDSCREKGDLVELILNFLNSRNINAPPTGLYQGSANISQNRSGSGYTQPSGGPQPGLTNLQNTAERLYQQAHQQFFGVSGGTTDGRTFGTATTTANFAQSSQPHGPFATSQYSSSARPSQHSSQERRAPIPTPRENTSNERQTNQESNEQHQTTTTTQETTPDESSEPAPTIRRRGSLKDIGTVDDIEQLSIRQLKEILRANFVDYKGCVERYELSDRVKRLHADREGIKAKEGQSENNVEGDESMKPSSEDSTCRICMDATIDCVLLECGHMVTCTTCGKQMNECPICRQYVVRCVHIFKS